MSDALTLPMVPTNSQGQTLVSIQNLLCLACTNAGITLPMDSLTQPMVPGASEGLLLTSIQNLAYLLATRSTPAAGSTQTGQVAIGNNVTTITGTFATPFASAPKGFVTQVLKANGAQSNYFATAYSVSTTGFTVDLQAPTDAASYILSFIAAP